MTSKEFEFSDGTGAPDMERLKNTLRERIFGQDKVLDKLASKFPSGRAAAPLILMGAPGIGKTAMAKKLAEIWAEESGATMIQLNGADFKEKMAGLPGIGSLLGVPPGFEGFDGSDESPVAEETSIVAAQSEAVALAFHEGSAAAVTCMKPLRLKATRHNTFSTALRGFPHMVMS